MLLNVHPIRHISVLILIFQIAEGFQNCPVEECTHWFTKTKEYEYLIEGSSERYCQVLQAYRKCLNDSLRSCRGLLKYHSIEYLVKKQWAEYCSNIQIHAPAVEQNRCHFLPSLAQSNIRYCSLFGQLHVRKLDGTWDSCSDPGAQAVIDNRYFLVQITNTWINHNPYISHISRVTVLLRKHNCTQTRQLVYSASSEDDFLPISFDGGSTYVNVDGNRRAIEVLRQASNYIELNLRYIDSSVHIRKQGLHLTVSVRAPQFVLQSGSSYSSSQQICSSGCRSNFAVPIHKALAKPQEYAHCYALPLRVPLHTSLERCRKVNVTDTFLDACTYDHMVTGSNDTLLYARDAQHDFKRVFPLHYQYITGRRHLFLQKIPENSTIFSNCYRRSSTSSPFNLNFSHFFLLFLYFFYNFFL